MSNGVPKITERYPFPGLNGENWGALPRFNGHGDIIRQSLRDECRRGCEVAASGKINAEEYSEKNNNNAGNENSEKNNNSEKNKNNENIKNNNASPPQHDGSGTTLLNDGTLKQHRVNILGKDYNYVQENNTTHLPKPAKNENHENDDGSSSSTKNSSSSSSNSTTKKDKKVVEYCEDCEHTQNMLNIHTPVGLVVFLLVLAVLIVGGCYLVCFSYRYIWDRSHGISAEDERVAPMLDNG